MHRKSEADKNNLELAAVQEMQPFVTLENTYIKWESSEYHQDSKEELGRRKNQEPRMFSLNQIRELVYLHLHRSEFKTTLEVDHTMRMDDIKEYAVSIEKKLPPIVASISAERKSILDLIDTIKFEENQFRLRSSLESQD